MIQSNSIAKQKTFFLMDITIVLRRKKITKNGNLISYLKSSIQRIYAGQYDGQENTLQPGEFRAVWKISREKI